MERASSPLSRQAQGGRQTPLTTWNSKANRDQVRDGMALLSCLLPLFIDLMMDNPEHEWPMPNYPVVD